MTRAGVAATALLTMCALLAGCANAHRSTTRADERIPAALAARSRPIGHGARFHPPARGPVLGPCRGSLGAREAVHVEVFAADRVVLLATGIGTRAPRALQEGRVVRARCYGSLVTLEPTGVVLVRRGARLTVADLFRAWGQPLTDDRIASFAGSTVTAYVNGRPDRRDPLKHIPLRRHDEIVLEIGPHVPPHATYRFPPGL